MLLIGLRIRIGKHAECLMFNELGGVLVEETEGKWQLECVYIDRTPKILSYHPYHPSQPSVHVVKGDKRTQGDIMIKELGGNVKR